MNTGLAVVDLAVRYAGSTPFCLAKATFHVARGQTLGILGESGSGKSTLLKALLGLLPQGAQVSAGSVRLDDTDLPLDGDAAFRTGYGGLAFVPEEVDATWDTSVAAGQILHVLCRDRSRDPHAARPRSEAWLERLGVPDAARTLDAPPHTLALGVRQRLLLAMALASEPRGLVLDCPTSFLDPLSEAHAVAELRACQRDQGFALIVASNDVDLLAGLADDLLVLHAGQIVEQGPAREVLGQARHPYTASLLEPWRRPGHFRIPMLSFGKCTSLDAAGCSFADRCARRLNLPSAERCKAEVPALEAHGQSLVRCFFPKIRDSSCDPVGEPET